MICRWEGARKRHMPSWERAIDETRFKAHVLRAHFSCRRAPAGRTMVHLISKHECHARLQSQSCDTSKHVEAHASRAASNVQSNEAHCGPDPGVFRASRLAVSRIRVTGCEVGENHHRSGRRGSDQRVGRVLRQSGPQRYASCVHGPGSEGPQVSTVTVSAHCKPRHAPPPHMHDIASQSGKPGEASHIIHFHHRHVKGLMKKAGLSVREDVMGNIFGRWIGSEKGAGLQAESPSSLCSPLLRGCAVLSDSLLCSTWRSPVTSVNILCTRLRRRSCRVRLPFGQHCERRRI